MYNPAVCIAISELFRVLFENSRICKNGTIDETATDDAHVASCGLDDFSMLENQRECESSNDNNGGDKASEINGWVRLVFARVILRAAVCEEGIWHWRQYKGQRWRIGEPWNDLCQLKEMDRTN